MAKQSIVEPILAAMKQAKRPSTFSCEGVIEADPGLVVEGVGPVKLPLGPVAGRKLAEMATQAPYGKRTKTIVDTSVRDTLEIAADAVLLSDSFNRALENAVKEVAGALRLDERRLEVELYKLLIYRKGGFFLPHRDSEKRRGMVATMIVVLPSKFRGGELLVVHGAVRKRFDFSSGRSQSAAQYAAFFADCQHEVTKVTSGVRVCLAFNLILKPSAGRGSKTDSNCDPRLLGAVDDWMQNRGEDPLVFAFEHQYTERGLKPTLLKGADKELYGQLLAVAEAADCRLHLGQVSRHLSQYADDGSFDYGRRFGRRGGRGWSGDYDDLEIGEAYEDDIVIDAWRDAGGKVVEMGELRCDSSQLVSATPVEDWIPTQQEYEGYTGNAGNTLDRWYHKSAVVMWSNRMHYEVIAQMGLQGAIEQWLALRSELADLEDEELEAACDDCEALAEAIIRHWPHKNDAHRGGDFERQPWLEKFASDLPKYGDVDLAARFLRTLAERDRRLNLDQFVSTSLKLMGADAIVPYLEEMLASVPQQGTFGAAFVNRLPERDAAWLCKLCREGDAAVASKTLHRMLKKAIEKHERHAKTLETEAYQHDLPASTWLLLCQAAISVQGDSQVSRLLKLLDACPKVFDIRSFQVPTAKSLRGWCEKHATGRPAVLETWMESIKRKLQAATSARPSPPSDFRRDGNTECSCPVCRQLSEFLIDGEQKTARIAAPEHLRTHMQDVIRRKRLDVTAKLDRSFRPYALLLTKTTGSYQRALTQYESDLKALASLG